MNEKIQRVLDYIDDFNFTDEEKAEIAAHLMNETNMTRDPCFIFIKTLQYPGELHSRFEQAAEEES